MGAVCLMLRIMLVVLMSVLDRLMAQLTQALGESGWLDDVKHKSKGKIF